MTARPMFLFFLAFWAFAAGLLVAHLRLPPYPFLARQIAVADRLLEGPAAFDSRILPRPRYPGAGVVTHDPVRAYPGLTLMQGTFAEGPQIRVYDMAGTVRLSWPLDFHAAFPDTSHIYPQTEVPQNRFGFHTQGLVLGTDGSMTMNYAEKGLVRYDRCGRLLWTLARMTHHSVTANPDGTMWVPVKLDTRGLDPALLLPLTTQERLSTSLGFYADAILLVSPEGRTLREIPLLPAVFDWYARSGQAQDLIDAHLIDALDPTHLNDIEVVTEALAARVPAARAGFLLLSFRSLNMLAILDPEAGRIVWAVRSGWFRQHDPDITAEGMIELFDNGLGVPFPGRDFAGSRILSYDPATGAVRTLYPVRTEEGFFSVVMGVQERLPNGNLLITESIPGRLIEAAPDGTIVWDLRIPAVDHANAVIDWATRLPAPGGPFADPGC